MLDTRAIFADIRREWIVPANLPYFDGHFPGKPVFPAIGILDASLALVRREAEQADLQLLGVVSAKFTAVLGPGARVLIATERVQDDEWQLDWSDGGATKYASLRLKVGK